MQKNPYNILGVDPKSTPEEIKIAYRNLAREHHPDKGGDAEIFKEIAAAYSVLSDPEKRARFDSGESYDSIRGPAIDNELRALSAIAQVFVELMKGQGAEYVDMVKEMVNVFKNAQGKFKSQKKDAEHQIMKFERIVKRIERKDGGDENIFVRASVQQIEMFKRTIENADRELDVSAKALEILDKYKYNIEELPMLISNDGFTVTSTGFSLYR